MIQFAILKYFRRVSIVATRFILDTMPGKMIAIDSDLKAGNITEDEACQRQIGVCKKVDFFGVMDGVG
jgi:flagellar biosynthesis protein FlhA